MQFILSKRYGHEAQTVTVVVDGPKELRKIHLKELWPCPLRS